MTVIYAVSIRKAVVDGILIHALYGCRPTFRPIYLGPTCFRPTCFHPDLT